jgi:hypothetical protein
MSALIDSQNADSCLLQPGDYVVVGVGEFLGVVGETVLQDNDCSGVF